MCIHVFLLCYFIFFFSPLSSLLSLSPVCYEWFGCVAWLRGSLSPRPPARPATRHDDPGRSPQPDQAQERRNHFRRIGRSHRLHEADVYQVRDRLIKRGGVTVIIIGKLSLPTGLHPGPVPTLWTNQSTSPLVATATIMTPSPLGHLTIRWWPSRSHHLPRPLSYVGVFRSRTWVSPSCQWWEGYLPRLLYKPQLSSEREFTNFHLHVYMYMYDALCNTAIYMCLYMYHGSPVIWDINI